MVREAGLEPARPEWTLEPESSESANSTTRASSAESLIIIAQATCFVKRIFLKNILSPSRAAVGRASRFRMQIQEKNEL